MAEAPHIAPIGSIVAYAGPVGEQSSSRCAAFEAATGWMVCDGRQLDRHDTAHAALFDAILFSWGGNEDDRFNLPDLQGYFLRGIDERLSQENRDPDGASRDENNPGGNTGRSVGSVQNYATAAPTSAQGTFRTNDSGSHTHFMDFEINADRDVNGQSNTVAHPSPNPQPNQPTTEMAGIHNHIIEDDSGDFETRPINAYVNWIIRVA
jgi:microcystin-dependent protein